jgi:hypothetical protein
MLPKIERLYQVFSRYGRPRELEGCPCCTEPEEAAPLLRTPLRTIGAPELERYAFKALTTWGAIYDYKYFIPRILELTFEADFKAAYAAEHTNQTKRKLLNSFWDHNTANYERVLSWLYPRKTSTA